MSGWQAAGHQEQGLLVGASIDWLRMMRAAMPDSHCVAMPDHIGACPMVYG
jgi:hypothetical protein